MCGALQWVSTTLLVFAVSVRGQFTIDTPTDAGSCPTVQISWRGGTGPYQLQLLPGLHVGTTTPMRILQSAISGTSYQWAVSNLSPGKSVALVVKDSSGAQTATNSFVIQANNDCSSSTNGQNSSSLPPSTSTSSPTETSTSSSLSDSVSAGSHSSSTDALSTTSNYSGERVPSSSSPDSVVPSSTDSSAAPVNTAQDGSNSTSTRVDVIGPVVGSIFALLAILLAVFLFIYCRRRRRSSRTHPISLISDAPMSARTHTTFIQPFVSPTSESFTSHTQSPSVWHARPSKYATQNHYNPPASPSPSSSTSGYSRPNALTTEQARLVQQLVQLQVPATAVTQVIDQMLSNPKSSADASASSTAAEEQNPPAYDFKH